MRKHKPTFTALMSLAFAGAIYAAPALASPEMQKNHRSAVK